MTRTLYRIYLYLVLMLLLFFAATATANFLGSVVFTGLDNSTYSYGDVIAQHTQAVAMAFVSWVVVLIFGGLHYWLIRRDIAADPKAAQGPVRALFLNWAEFDAATVVVVAGGVALSGIGRPNYGVSGAVGFAVAFGGLFALLEWERRRSQAAPGAAIILQRLHFYGLQLILLFIATAWVLGAIQQTAVRLLISTGYATEPCSVATQNYGGSCSYDTGQYLGNFWLAALWGLGAWAAYRYLAPRDVASRLRSFFALAGFAYAVVFILIGVERGIELLLRQAFGAPDTNGAYGYDPAYVAYQTANDHVAFAAPLIFGLLVAGVYLMWLLRDARSGGAMSLPTTRQTVLAIAATLSAVPFWIGCALVLDGLIEGAVPDGAAPDARGWAIRVAVLVCGLGYVPLALLLGRQARRTEVHTPRRAFVFVLLAFGTLLGVISLIFTLYALVTQALGSPLTDWQAQARQGAANVAIGIIIVALYVAIARFEGWFRRQPEAAAQQKAAPAADTVEAVLDALLAGTLTRDRAAALIRTLYGPAISAPGPKPIPPEYL